MTYRTTRREAIKFISKQLGMPEWKVEKNLDASGYGDYYKVNKRERFRIDYES